MKVKVILAFLFIIGLWLRLGQLDEAIIFGYDQARDAYRARSIREGDLKLLGPETDIPGIHHGVLYYYLLAIPYSFSDNPAIASKFIAILSSFGIFLVFFLANKFFKNITLSLIASLLYGLSFEIVQYARWLSNPSLATVTVLLAFLGFWLWIKGKSMGLSLALLSIALSIHFQFFLSYLFILPLIIYLIYRPKTTKRSLILGLSSIFLIDLPFLISEIKFNFQTTKALFLYFSNQSNNFTPASSFIIRLIDRISSVFFHTVLPLNSTFALIFLVIMILFFLKNWDKLKKNQEINLLFIWLFSNFPVFIFSSGALNTEFSFVGSAVSLIFLTSFFIVRVLSKKSYRFIGLALLILIVISNLRYNLIHAFDGAYIFSVQRAMTYGLEKKLVDYTYDSAKNQPFSICTVTNPLFINTTWAYLYETYGKRKYSYVPYFSGADQSNYLGNLPKDNIKPKLRFLIFEPLIGITTTAVEIYTNLENKISQKVEEKSFGEFKVEKRLLYDEETRKKYKLSGGINPTDERYILYNCFH